MAEPLPCPWCPKPTEIDFDFKPSRDFQYYCVECGAAGPIHGTQLTALAAWNRRADGWSDPKTELPESGEWVLFRLHERIDKLHFLGDLHYGEFRDPRDWRDGDDGFHCRLGACELTYPIADVLCWMSEPPPPGERREKNDDG